MFDHRLFHSPLSAGPHLHVGLLARTCIALTIFSGAPAPAFGDAATSILDPARVSWTSIRFHVSKYLVSGDTTITLENTDLATLAEPLMEPGEGTPVEPDDEVLKLGFKIDSPGNSSQGSLLMNTRSGAAVQLVQLKKDRYRISRFTDIGRYRHTHRPTDGEESLPHAQWTDRSDDLRLFPADAAGATIAEPVALLYAIGAAPLEKPGDQLELFAVIRKQVFRVRAEVGNPKEIKIDYKEHSSTGTARRKGKTTPLRVLVRGEGLNPDDDEEFGFLGLRGDIEVYLQPETRVPLRLTGAMKVIGKVAFHLREVSLR
jgi:hypothetical protein